MKNTIEQIEFLLERMKEVKKEHPKATIYYDWEDHEMRITYPLPQDFQIYKTANCIRCNDNGCLACDGTKGSKYNPDGF